MKYPGLKVGHDLRKKYPNSSYWDPNRDWPDHVKKAFGNPDADKWYSERKPNQGYSLQELYDRLIGENWRAGK